MGQQTSATKQGDPKSAKQLGISYFFGEETTPQNYDEALKWFKIAAQNEPDAQFFLGVMYEDGKGVEQDFNTAAHWYGKAAKQNHPIAQYKLAELYKQGKGVECNEAEALLWYTKSAEYGYAVAQYTLGMLYYKSDGVTQDFSKALNWFTKAAENDQANSLMKLKQKKTSKFEYWRLRAIKQAIAKAQIQIGEIYEYGKGLKSDKNTAAVWYTKALEMGEVSAKIHLDQLKKSVKNNNSCSKSQETQKSSGNYIILRTLGRGGQGTVYLVEDPLSKMQFAMKVIEISNDFQRHKKNDNKTQVIDHEFKEITHTNNLDHKNILKFSKFFIEQKLGEQGELKNQSLKIVMPFCEEGNLLDYVIFKEEPIDESIVLEWLIQIVDALEYIHSHKIIHRDLTPHNILLTKENGCIVPKISDFGLAKNLNFSIANSQAGKLRYMAPEVMKNEVYDSSADIFSLGAIIFFVLSRENDFYVGNDKFIKLCEDLPYKFGDKYKSLILACTNNNPKQRPTANQILKDLKNIQSLLIEKKPHQDFKKLEFTETKSLVLSENLSKRNEITQENPSVSVSPRLQHKVDIRSWLTRIGMSKYIPIFIEKGFDDLEIIINLGLNHEEMVALGLPIGHKKKLLYEIEKLQRNLK